MIKLWYQNLGQLKNTFSMAGSVVIIIITFIILALFIKTLRKTQNKLILNDMVATQIKYIFNKSSEGICLISTDYKIIRNNDTFSGLFGINSCSGQKCYDICPNQLCQTSNCPLKQIIDGQNIVEELIKVKLPDNSTVFYEIIAVPYYDTNGNLAGIFESFRDVTKTRETEEFLNRYRLLIQHARDIIFFVREDGSIIEANHAAVNKYEYSYDELLSLNMKDLRITELQSLTLRQLQLATKEGIVFETVHKTKGGCTFPVEVSSIGTDLGNERILISIIRDISERKLAHQELEDQKNFSENLIQNLTIPTFVLDPQHRVMIWNQACEQLTGVKAEKVIGTRNHWKGFYSSKRPCLADVILDGSFDALPCSYKVLNQSNLNNCGLHAEGWYENLGGTRKFLIIETAPINNNQGSLVAVIQTVQDITNRKIIEEKLTKHNNQMQLELKLAAKVQQELIPKRLPSIPNISFAWRFEPSIYVAGDMFNVFSINESNIGFYILDVKGHGVSAALKAIAQHHLLSHTNYSQLFQNHDVSSFILPSKILKQLNGCCSTYYNDKNFFTIFYGVLNTEHLKLTYSRAGHCPSIVLSNDGNTSLLDKGGPAIGLLEGFEYTDTTIHLKTGDKVLLYTDGIMESDDIAKNPVTINDIVELAGRFRNLPVENIVDSIVSETQKRTKDLEVRDDVTVLGFEIS